MRINNNRGNCRNFVRGQHRWPAMCAQNPNFPLRFGCWPLQFDECKCNRTAKKFVKKFTEKIKVEIRACSFSMKCHESVLCTSSSHRILVFWTLQRGNQKITKVFCCINRLYTWTHSAFFPKECHRKIKLIFFCHKTEDNLAVGGQSLKTYERSLVMKSPLY